MATKTTTKQQGWGRQRRHEALTGWMFLLPFVILFGLSFLAPILVSIRSSLFRMLPSGGGLYGGGGLVETFVGTANFEQVLQLPALWQGLGRVILFGLFQIPIMIGLALTLALLLDSAVVRRPTFFRLGFFLPFAIPGMVAALLWTYIYSPRLSPINQVLEPLGAGIDFFSPNMILFSMANMTTWTFAGYNMLIFLAALQAIPRELYEAARIDGASEWKIVTQIKIPMVAPAAMLAILLSIIGTIQLFNEPTVLATVNPWMGTSFTPMMLAYNAATGQAVPSGSGPASAVSIVMAVFAGVLAAGYALIQRRLTR
ncbi:MAG: sugar ABC transporter permease [Propionibacteriaceae bacterium]|nr:sugar ABC transporter permease [Propionibacteriaceae bacterium]